MLILNASAVLGTITAPAHMIAAIKTASLYFISSSLLDSYLDQTRPDNIQGHLANP
jgi:hypothetical protein